MGLPVFCFVGLCVCCVGRFLLFLSGDWFSPFLAFDAQGRHSSQDCHHRHDERSTGAKKKVLSSSSWRSFHGNVLSGQSRYRCAMRPKSWAWMYWVWYLKARRRWVSFLRKAFDSLFFLRPPGVWRWPPDHTSRLESLQRAKRIIFKIIFFLWFFYVFIMIFLWFYLWFFFVFFFKMIFFRLNLWINLWINLWLWVIQKS